MREKSTHHENPITIIAPVIPDQLDNLRRELHAVREKLIQNKHLEFENIGTIHYARWLIIDSDNQEGNPENQGPKLVFSSNFDGTANDQIRDLSTQAAELFDQIYQACEGYPKPGNRNPVSRIEYLSAHSVKAASFYRGSPNRSLKQIRNESRLRNFMRDTLDAENYQNLSAKQIQKALQAAVNAKPEFAWAKDETALPKVNWFGMVVTGIVLLILSPLIILLILVIQFFYERKDTYFTLKRNEINDNKIEVLESYEDLEHQNQFSQLVVMKPGMMRLFTFKLLMTFSKVLIKFLFVEGQLMGIPTIHFARWVLFDNNKRVLFFSNFDGSWQQYLGDFIDKSGWGLTGIFSNTTNFPKTRFLFTGGAYDEEHFLAWSRFTEIQTQVWYNAYPKLSIKNVNNNSYLRHMLYKDLSEHKAHEFLKRL